MGKGERFIALIMLTHINLPSDSSREFYPNNHASNFRVKIPENFPILNSSKKYACAVTEVIFPSNFKNIPESQIIRMDLSFVNKLYHLRKDTGYSDGKDEHYAGKEEFEVEIPAGTWSVEKLIEKINNSIDKKIYKINFKYNDKTNRVVISAMSGSYISRLIIGKYLAPILGFRTFYGAKNRKKIGKKTTQIIRSPNQVSYEGGLDNLYMYTNIIREQYVGSTNTPLLRIINWTQTKTSGGIGIQFDQLYFCPLLTNNFDTIQIVIMDKQGQEVMFNSGTCVVILQFKEIEQ